MNVALIVNQSKEDAESFRKVIVDALEKRGIQPRLFLNKDFLKSDFIDIDCIITLGGDGTILHTAGVLSGMETPILGINAGHLGYLTEIRKRRDIERSLERLLSGDYVEDRRTMLEGTVFRNGREIFSRFALNELLISRVRGVGIPHRFSGGECFHHESDMCA